LKQKRNKDPEDRGGFVKARNLAFLIVFGVLLIDQVLKVWIKLNMYLGQEYVVAGNWFIIHFTENNGMAFGWQFAGDYGKIILTLVRIIAVSLITYYLFNLFKQKAHKGLVVSISLILAGALGNIIDSAFYGVIFSESGNFLNPDLAVLFPDGGGYATLLHGRVVDMFYFPIIQGYYPTWSPIRPGQEFIFFRPVFNIADSAITCGVIILLVFQKRFFHIDNRKTIYDNDDSDDDLDEIQKN